MPQLLLSFPLVPTSKSIKKRIVHFSGIAIIQSIERLCESEFETSFMPTFKFIVTGHCGWAQERKCVLFFTWALKLLPVQIVWIALNYCLMMIKITRTNEAWSILMRFYFFQSTFFFIFFHFVYQFRQHIAVLVIKNTRASEFIWKREFFKSIVIIVNFSINQKNPNITMFRPNSYDCVIWSMHLCQAEC